jgi:2-dehydro-3-deoxyglucarate aldolase
MAKFPPEGIRGASLCRASGFGKRFPEYFAAHNREVIVVVMLEHIKAVQQAEAILATPGIDAALIGPYDLSASMNLAGQLDHPDVRAVQQTILDACRRQKVAAGLHVVPLDAAEVHRRIEQGFRFLPCGIDTAFVREGCRQMLKAREN